ncbi:MAG: APC family permease, partial [Gammaproteobacteria bacterium]|nr:APC family permease [Gammaproteobacteria bacterium]
MSDREASAGSRSTTGLARELGLMGLVATGICAMLGAAINVMPFMIQRSVPGIGPWVLPAYLFAAVPAVLAALAYASLGSAMPRAGGSYIYASRALSPYWGFVASFSQWFGLSIAIGVVSYILIPFLRDIAGALEWVAVADALDTGAVRVGLALAFLWTFVLVNVRGLELYERTLVPMMFLMFALGAVVIVAGFAFDHGDFAAALSASEGRSVPEAVAPALEPRTLLAASVLLFATFIGFDSIAQAGGEAKNPGRNLPLAIGLAITIVGGFYFLFTAAVYHAVPWSFIAAEAQVRDLTAPGLLGYLLPAGWTVVIVGGAAVALINDLPAMLLAVSRMMFAWAEDGIFPKRAAAVHPRRRTPHVAIIASGIMASVGIVGSHLAGDFFLGIDILGISM